jgi:hypothetical protein
VAVAGAVVAAAAARPGMRGSSGTVLVHHSIMKLPEKAMMQRNYDERVGFDSMSFVDFGTDEHRSVNKRIINRFRLEKKDAAGGRVRAREADRVLHRQRHAGQVGAVREARRGIVAGRVRGGRLPQRDSSARDAEERPRVQCRGRALFGDSLGAGARTKAQSLIRDPRSGENPVGQPSRCIRAPGHWARRGTSSRPGAVDKRAQQLPLPDELSGELVRFQVAHQIGHALGLPHNLKASATYTARAGAGIRKWVKENGFVASGDGRCPLQLRRHSRKTVIEWPTSSEDWARTTSSQ